MPQIDYTYTFPYRTILSIFDPAGGSAVLAPALSVILRNGSSEFSCIAIVDTGSMFSLFDPQIGKVLGLDITTGSSRKLSSLGGSFTGYSHNVDLSIDLGDGKELLIRSMEVLFSDRSISRSILGRSGFFFALKIGISERTQELYVEPE